MKMTPQNKWYVVAGGIASITAVLVVWFNFAGWPPYPSVQSVQAVDRKATTALQRALENKVDAQRQRVDNQLYLIDLRGKTPERRAALRQLEFQLEKDQAARDRAYQKK